MTVFFWGGGRIDAEHSVPLCLRPFSVLHYCLLAIAIFVIPSEARNLAFTSSVIPSKARNLSHPLSFRAKRGIFHTLCHSERSEESCLYSDE